MLRAVLKLTLEQRQSTVNQFKNRKDTDDMLRDQGAFKALDTLELSLKYWTEVLSGE